MVDDLQTRALPESTEELERCAVWMEYMAGDRKKAVEPFHADHQRHMTVVHRTFQSLFSEPKTSPIIKVTLRVIAHP